MHSVNTTSDKNGGEAAVVMNSRMGRPAFTCAPG